MDWKQIPAAPAYEINQRAQVRNKHTLRPVVLCGRRVVMAVDPFALAEMLFTAPEPGQPAERGDAHPHVAPEDTERTITELRRQVRELSDELEQYTAGTAF
ncbi:hypothetical protein [Nitratidesulfovibrio liaohensis]|uniref:Uncharacterized protein n=1 Tax=Nitratidesulfovibrio liaohensis TaxID=2604158 RepID=A0ABY9R4G3_9BACT|nr:hypothetical protein [Nitratidesulfovibrio liaohensis]WMW66638.1 hypothetical protein KPS_001241 [Nitratidesulfovibrio liaohensis]